VVEALPFEAPEFSATPVFPAGEDFASLLEQAISGSGVPPKVISSTDRPTMKPEARAKLLSLVSGKVDPLFEARSLRLRIG
jgi:hypothetical protein